MNVRQASICIVLATAFSQGAFAQGASPVGTWKSGAMVHKEWPIAATVQITVTSIDAQQKASGQLQAFMAGGGGGSANCPRAPLSGTFDGSTLKLASPATNLCPERTMELKFAGTDEMKGSYRGGFDELVSITFTRVK
ncbi:MAG: hypothetical protein HY854_04025 [Burkholderiales bacterium]|nr:hypothetical protein [Burkholderiales bacterium]